MKFFGPAHHCVVVAPCIILWGTPLLSVPAALRLAGRARVPISASSAASLPNRRSQAYLFSTASAWPHHHRRPLLHQLFLRSTSTIIRDELHAQSCTVPGAAVITPQSRRSLPGSSYSCFTPLLRPPIVVGAARSSTTSGAITWLFAEVKLNQPPSPVLQACACIHAFSFPRPRPF